MFETAIAGSLPKRPGSPNRNAVAALEASGPALETAKADATCSG